MRNGVLVNRIFATFAIVVFTGLLAVGVSRAADDSDTDADAQHQDYGIAELQGRAEAAVEEVNEAQRVARENAEAVKRERYNEEFGYVPEGNLLSNGELAALGKQREEKEKTIRTRAGQEIKSLEEHKTGATETTAAGQPVESRPRLPAPASTAGTVTGIVFCENKGAALLFGDIVRENDVIRGVKVLKVMPDYVEFEKQDRKWKQEVGQAPPASVWEQQPAPAKQSSTNPNPKASR
jgi:hypothetical protein